MDNIEAELKQVRRVLDAVRRREREQAKEQEARARARRRAQLLTGQYIPICECDACLRAILELRDPPAMHPRARLAEGE